MVTNLTAVWSCIWWITLLAQEHTMGSPLVQFTPQVRKWTLYFWAHLRPRCCGAAIASSDVVVLWQLPYLRLIDCSISLWTLWPTEFESPGFREHGPTPTLLRLLQVQKLIVACPLMWSTWYWRNLNFIPRASVISSVVALLSDMREDKDHAWESSHVWVIRLLTACHGKPSGTSINDIQCFCHGPCLTTIYFSTSWYDAKTPQSRASYDFDSVCPISAS